MDTKEKEVMDVLKQLGELFSEFLRKNPLKVQKDVRFCKQLRDTFSLFTQEKHGVFLDLDKITNKVLPDNAKKIFVVSEKESFKALGIVIFCEKQTKDEWFVDVYFFPPRLLPSLTFDPAESVYIFSTKDKKEGQEYHGRSTGRPMSRSVWELVTHLDLLQR